MGRTACTEPQCLYKVALYLFLPIACCGRNVNCSELLLGLNDLVALLNMKDLTAKRRTSYRHFTHVDIIVINCCKDETQNCRYLDEIAKFHKFTAGFLKS